MVGIIENRGYNYMITESIEKMGSLGTRFPNVDTDRQSQGL